MKNNLWFIYLSVFFSAGDPKDNEHMSLTESLDFKGNTCWKYYTLPTWRKSFLDDSVVCSFLYMSTLCHITRLQFLYSICTFSFTCLFSLLQPACKPHQSRGIGCLVHYCSSAHSKCFTDIYWIKGCHLHWTLLRVNAFFKGTLVNCKVLKEMTFHSWW